jgi:hypothetical protein
MKDVLKRADDREIEMELPEAEKIAQDEIIHILGEEERVRVREQYRIALKEFETTFEKERGEKEEDYRKRSIKNAAWVVSLAVKRWQARKKLRLLCEETFEKLFDEQYQAFYYRNKRTVRNLLAFVSLAIYDSHC